jgi:ribosomal protein L24
MFPVSKKSSLKKDDIVQVTTGKEKGKKASTFPFFPFSLPVVT